MQPLSTAQPPLLDTQLHRRLVILCCLLASTPSLTITCLYALSWRATLFLGSWPQPSVNDPKYIAPDDPLMSLLYTSVFPLLACTFVSVFTLPALALYLRRWLHWQWLLALLLVFSLSLWLLLVDSGARLSWFAD